MNLTGWLELLFDFFAMGGYARYVWPAYGVTALVLSLNVMLPARRERKLMRRLRGLHGRRPHNKSGEQNAS